MSKQSDVLLAPVARACGYLSTSPTNAYELLKAQRTYSEIQTNQSDFLSQ